MVSDMERENFELKCQVDKLELKLEMIERKLVINSKEKACSFVQAADINDDSAIGTDISCVNISSTLSSNCTKCSDDSCLLQDRALLNKQGCNYCDTAFESMEEFLQSVNCINQLCDDCQKFVEVQPWFKPSEIRLPT